MYTILVFNGSTYHPRRVGSDVSQSSLDRFTMLEELDVTICQTFTNVDFCAATLRALNAILQAFGRWLKMRRSWRYCMFELPSCDE